MNPDMMDILVEPRTHLPLALEAAEYNGQEVAGGRLESPSGKSYPIIGGIPRFVESSDYAGSFGMQWNRFAKTQLDSRTGCHYSRSRFEKEVGWEKRWAADKLILDAGCGAGRFAEIAAGLKCRLIAIDMSDAVDAARSNLSGISNVDFVQASIYELPFRPGAFDAFYSIGVLQHTPDPYKALGCLFDMIHKEGRFAITAYGKAPWTKFYSKYILRRLISMLHLPDEKLLQYIEKIMPVGFPATDFLFRVPLLKKVFRFIIPIANYVERDDMARQQRYEEAILDTFDMLSPKYDNPLTVEEVSKILREHDVRSYKILSRRPVNLTGEK